jgi:hypothetical protein
MSLPQTSSGSGRFSVLAAVGAAVVQGVFVVVYVVSRRPVHQIPATVGAAPEDAWKFSSEGRAARLSELRAKESSAATSYGWVDQAAGVVRLPIDRAVELTIRDLNAPAAKPSTPRAKSF